MSIRKIVILEGTSCVGKTTLCESLAAQGWIVLPEAIRYLEDETGKGNDTARAADRHGNFRNDYGSDLYHHPVFRSDL